MRTFKIDSSVEKYDLSKFYGYTKWHDFHRYFVLGAGQEHYKLLAMLSAQCAPGETIYDIGTHVGFSALAMAYNDNVKVVSYDLTDHFPQKDVLTAKDTFNIDIRFKNCLEDIAEIAKSPLVFLDVDPHDGIQEKEIVTALAAAGFRGILVCDDIYKSEEMRNWWASVYHKKYDVSRFGHWSGTGIIVFDYSEYDVMVH